MSDIIFNPDEANYEAYRGRPTGGLITRFFAKLAGVQKQETVSKIMLVVAIIFFILSGIILYLYL